MVRSGPVIAGVVTILCLAAGTGGALVATPAAAGQQAGAAVTWGPAREVPGSAALNTAGAARVSQVTCPAPGDCVAVGTYQHTEGIVRGFAADAANGKWTTAQDVPTGWVTALSCAPGGACTDLAGTATSLVAETETAGTGAWSAPQPITLSPDPLGASAFDLGLLSCNSAGNCAAAGSYNDAAGHRQALVTDEKDGTWGTGQEVPGTAALNAGNQAYVYALSCASDGNCAAGGSYQDADGLRHAYVASETAGTWGAAIELPGIAALEAGGNSTVESVSCGAPGDCAAVGTYWSYSGATYQAFVANETNGAWGNAIELPGSAALNVLGNAQLRSVSCPSAGDCAAGGFYSDAAGDLQPLVADEVAGTWVAAHALSVSAIDNARGTWVLSVSCASVGNCAAGGYNTDSANHNQAMLITQTDGTWGAATELPGVGALNAGGDASVVSVSCTPSGGCAAGGYYTDSAKQRQAFTANTVEATTTGITVSKPAVTFGDEQSATLSVSVSGQATPAPGSVTVASAAGTVCVITLIDGAGTCTVPATRLPVGTAALTASYPGSDFLAASVSAPVALRVKAAPSGTMLSLSAGRVTYGHEQSARATVAVTSGYGLSATGKVALKSGSATLCTIILVTGRGTCTLGAARLPAGSWHLSAAYSGSANIAASASPSVPLTVAKAGTATTLTLSAARVRYGAERTEHLTVAVTAKYGKVPGAKVAVKSGRTVLCTVTLASGKGTCTLAASQLHPGAYTLTVAYPGSANLARSVSAKKTLTVIR